MSVIPVIDTETTGFVEPVEALEFALVPVMRAKKAWLTNHALSWSQLCDVDVPIEIGAMATHHITKGMLEGQPRLNDVLSDGALDDCEYAAAHNAAYDSPIVERALGRKLKWICTWRCAMHLYPDAPGHSNQVLRYHLGLPGPVSSLPPHRALPDAEVTAHLLEHMLQSKTPEELYALTNAPVLLTTVRFGKFRGEKYADVVRKDVRYFRDFVLGKGGFDEDVQFTVRHYLALL